MRPLHIFSQTSGFSPVSHLQVTQSMNLSFSLINASAAHYFRESTPQISLSRATLLISRSKSLTWANGGGNREIRVGT